MSEDTRAVEQEILRRGAERAASPAHQMRRRGGRSPDAEVDELEMEREFYDGPEPEWFGRGNEERAT